MNRWRERYKRLKAAGICVNCGTRPRNQITFLCNECREKTIISRKAYEQRVRQDPEKRIYRLAYRRERSHQEPDRQKNAQRAKARREYLTSINLCTTCAKFAPMKGKRICAICFYKAIESHKTYQKKLLS